jgi:hypothetical protein
MTSSGGLLPSAWDMIRQASRLGGNACEVWQLGRETGRERLRVIGIKLEVQIVKRRSSTSGAPLNSITPSSILEGPEVTDGHIEKSLSKDL